MTTQDEKEALVRVIEAYKSVFASAEGQIVLGDLMRRFAYTRKSTFVKGDPHASAAQEGQRSVLVHVGVMLDADVAQVQEYFDSEMEG